ALLPCAPCAPFAPCSRLLIPLPPSVAARRSAGVDAVAGDVVRAGEFHALLGDEAREERVEGLHDLAVAVDVERAPLLDRAHAFDLDVAGDDAGERAAKVGGEAVRFLPAIEVQARH